ncbi:CHAT domain-containing protein [Calothrix sp. FACHB-1219]|uniref:CHAT domain-containing protein n=1 Tax=unclassified Calothrix TaxID=2619626 RepID=UPI001688B496|nr:MULTISPECIES: CHAT domain-containing protein [unclassified Calothrix]MBD2201910.1 CHAT domain-containing protein [Calothrix sp. FACHB-168]MBD2216945.1 CHAT domain-containing protein [Calothrix sp. FACHB-1219]
MKILKHLLLTLLTASLCIFLSPSFAINPPQQTPAQILYQAGKYAEAIDILKQTLATFNHQGNKLNAAMTLSNLSLAYQQLGQWQEAETAITQSLDLLAKLSTPESSQILAQALDIQGRLQLSQGNAEAALNNWQAAAKIYQQLKDEESLIRNQINQAQAMQNLGLYLQADKTLIAVADSLNKLPDSPVKAAGLLNLGNIRRLVGNFQQSEQKLTEALQVAERVKSAQIISDIRLSQGNTYRNQRDIQINLENKEIKNSIKSYTEKAITSYQQAINPSATPTTRINAKLNLISLLIDEKDWQQVGQLLPQIKYQLAELPVSRTSVYAKINFAQSLIKYGEYEPSTFPSAIEILQQAIKEAQSLKDKRGESYALGTLGVTYQKTGNLTQAKKLTQQALSISQSINAPDITYQWLWHLGNYIKSEDRKTAMKFYEKSWEILQSLRTDLIAMNQSTQFSFRENIEPVYRDFVDLLLQEKNSQADNLNRARQVIESLQVAEIDNFLRTSCLRPITPIDQLADDEPATAIIYPIILGDRVETIVKLSKEKIKYYTTNISKIQVEETIRQLRGNLAIDNRKYEVKELSEKIYDWLIRPAKAELETNQIKTLVFVLDGALRNIPMSILYDREQQKYLIQNYAIALAPSLQLVEPKPLKKVKLNALIGGVSEELKVGDKTFIALPNVKSEIAEIRSELAQNQELHNASFTTTNLETKVKSEPFSVVHLATHGQFSSNSEETYILTWDKLLKVNELDNLLRTRDNTKPESIELLVLSACKTAKGDKQAALGLAGVAVKSGARSTLASLWVADDPSAKKIMREFYKQLKTGVSKAEALRRAQLSVFAELESSPFQWAPYVLVGNWL